MKDQNKTKAQLIAELEEIRQRVSELENNQSPRGHAEEELSFLSAVVEQSTEGMAIAGLDGKLIYINTAWCKMHGYKSSEELLGKKLAVFHTEEQMENDVKPFNERVKEYGAYSGEVGHVTKDGKPFPTLMVTTLLKDEQGAPIAMAGIAKDITKRKQTEQVLSESEQRFSVLSAAAFEGIGISDKGRIVDVNEQLAAMLGYEQSEMKGLTVEKFVAPESLELVMKHVQSGSEEPYEHLALRKDGSTFPVEIRAKSLPYKGDIVRVTAIRDITARRQAEETLRLQGAALEAAANGIVITDREGIIQWANPAFTKLTGYSLAEALGKNPRDLVKSGKQDKAFYKNMWNTILAGRVWRGDLVNRRKDGTLYNEEMTLTPLKDEREEVTHFIAVKQEVTERVRTEQAIRESEARYRSLFENMLNGYAYCKMIFEGDHPQDFIYLDVNQAFESLTGLQDVIGKKVSEVIPGIRETDPELFEIYGRVALTGTPEVFETYLEALNMWFSVSVYSPKKEYFVAVFDVITNRKQAEQALRESQERLSGMIDSAMDAIVTLNSEQRIILFNPAAVQMFRCSAKEAMGQPLDTFIPERFREVHREHIRAFGQTNQTSRSTGVLGPLSCLRANGEEFPAEIAISQTEMTGAKIYTAILRDITERKRAEEALIESEERLRLFIEHAPASLAMFDREMRYLAVSHRWMMDYNLGDEDIIGRSHYDVFPEISNEWKAVHRRGLVGEVVQAEEDSFERLDGSVQWLRWEVRPWIAANGDIDGIVIFTEDITERVLVDEALRKNEALLTEAQRIGHIGHWEWTAPDNDLICSDELFQIFEIQKDGNKISRDEIAALISPKDQERLRGLDAKAFADRADLDYEFSIQLPDGRLRYLHQMANVTYGEDGKPVRMIGIVQDITESKKAKQALLEREEHYRTLFEHLPIPAFTKDREGKYTSSNVENQRYWADNPIGRTDAELLAPKVATALRDNDLHVLETGEALTEDEFFDDTPLGERKFLSRKVPLRDGNGNIIGILGASVDITERKRAEQALREAETKYRTLVEQIPNAVTYIDSADLAIGTYYVSPQIESMLGFTPEEWAADPKVWHKRLHPEDQDRIMRADKRHDETGGPFSQEYRMIASDGREVWVHDEAIMLRDEAGKPQYSHGIMVDITEHKRAERMLNRRVDELSALYKTTLDIISAQALPDLLDTIVMRAVDLLEGTSGGLYLSDPNQRQVRCVVSYNTSDDYTGTILAYGEGAAGIVAQTGEPLIIDDYRTWDERAEVFNENQPFRAVISVPMLWRGQVTGVIHVLRGKEDRKFTQEDLKLLTAFANQAAVAVENAHLLEETQRRLERMATMRRIDEAITSSLDLRVTLNILLGHVLQQLEVDASAVLLYQPELQNLEFVAGQGFRTRALQATRLRLGQGFAGQAAREGRIIQVYDLSQLETGFLRSPDFRNEGFVSYLGVPLIAKGNIVGVLEIYHRQQLDPDWEWMEFLETLAGQAAIAIDNIRLFEGLQTSNLQLRYAYDATIEGWAQALELRDMETKGHSHRTVELTIELARRLGVEDKDLPPIRWGALLHDIGKMGVPDSILQKPGPLTYEEWDIMRQHPVHARKWLSKIEYLQPALDIPYCHHEKWNGSGYPQGLKGKQIPLAARIFAVVDVWDALRSERPYRKAWSRGKALAYLREQSGQHFDPQVLAAFLDLLAEQGE